MLAPLPQDLAIAVAEAETRLGGFSRLRHLAEVASTNDVAIALALAGEPEGTAVLADLQRAGRGRRGRDWHSPPGAGIYLSVVARPGGPRTPVGSLSMITLAAGSAAATAVQAIAGLPVELKWPNDLVIGRPWRKLGGILCETTGSGSQVDAVVIGIGINLLRSAYPREIAARATSIELELGRPIDRAPLVVELLARMREATDRLRADDRAAIGREWRRFGHAGLNGAPVRWRDHDRERRGRAWDIDLEGALMVESDGQTERLVAGEVTWDWLP